MAIADVVFYFVIGIVLFVIGKMIYDIIKGKMEKKTTPVVAQKSNDNKEEYL